MDGIVLFTGPCTPGSPAVVRRRIRALQGVLRIASRVIEDLELAATELITTALDDGAQLLEVQLHDLRTGADGELALVVTLTDRWGLTRDGVQKLVRA
jgi:hypothetical protein